MKTAWTLQRLMDPGEKVNQGFRRVPVLFANESKWSTYVSWILISGSLRQGEWWGHRLFLSSGVDTILSPTTWISQLTGFGTDHPEKPQLNHRRGCNHWERIGIQSNDLIGQVNLSKLQETVEDRKACCAAIHGVAENQTQLSDWTTTMPSETEQLRDRGKKKKKKKLYPKNQWRHLETPRVAIQAHTHTPLYPQLDFLG